MDTMHDQIRGLRRIALGVLLMLGSVAAIAAAAEGGAERAAALLRDDAAGNDWPAYGRSFGEQHYSPLAQIDATSVARLGLAWSYDLGSQNSMTQPIAVDGVLYFASGFSVVHAMDARSGKLLWTFDPGAAREAGMNLRLGWGSRGIAWWNGRIYTATQDGRLIALDARDGRMLWEVRTFPKTDARYISAAPRVFDGSVVIGNAGDIGAVRGYVTSYDAETGRQLWRFYTVPGNPADGFEDAAMRRAAATWSGEWWKFGGGGTVWNSIAYDPDTHTLFIGTGNGYPYNRKVRSAGEGDNLYLCSVVALDARTGEYKWHYQVNPGETWDYNAAMDIQLAVLPVDGNPRRVVLTAPKNGFFYVLDRDTGTLISAEPIAKTTWASRIDHASGRPVEDPAARYPQGTRFELWPSPFGAHNWFPMSYSPRTGLVYIPVAEMGAFVSDSVSDYAGWKAPLDRTVDGAMIVDPISVANPLHGTGALLAWDPARQQAAWKIPRSTPTNGGVMSTGGDLVFEGTIEGDFRAHDARSGELLWRFDARAPVLAPPISYLADGRQMVTVLTGIGTSAGVWGQFNGKYAIDPRTQARRVLTFALDGQGVLPPRPPEPGAIPDPDFVRDAAQVEAGAGEYNRYCVNCHGVLAISGTHAPDLRRSPVILTAAAFARILHDGAAVDAGMPAFAEVGDERREALRHYLRSRAADLRAERLPP